MDFADLIFFFELNKVGVNLEVEGKKILEIRPNGKEVNVEIHDIVAMKKLNEELKKWKA